jgi:hypothetical protein
MGLDLDDYDFENPIGFDGENEYNFYGEEYSEFGWFKDKFVKGIKSFVKNPLKATKDLVVDTGRNVVKVAKAIKKGIGTIALAPLRAGALHVISNNGFRMADKLAPAYLSDNDPILKKYKKEAIDKARGQKETMRRWWVDYFDGQASKFEKAILEGRGRPPQILLKGKKINFDGSVSEFIYSSSFDGKEKVFYGYLPEGSYLEYDNNNDEKHSNFYEILTGASVAAALGLIKALIEKMKSGGVPDQPYQEGTTEFNTSGGNAPIPEVKTDEKTPIVSPDGKAIIDPTTGATFKTEELKTSPDGAKAETSLQTNPDGTPKTDEKFLGMPKKVGIGVTVGVGVLALTGIIIAVARKK